MKLSNAIRIVLTGTVVFVSLSPWALAQQAGHWVSVWGAAQHAPLTFPGFPPPPEFDNQTIRMVVRPTVGGARIRLRFSNRFGTEPLTLGAVHVALLDKDSRIVTATDKAVSFGGNPSFTVPPGAPVLSDPIDIQVPALAELAVSVYLPKKSPVTTTHLVGQHSTYVGGPGDLTSAAEISDAKPSHAWYWLDRVEVWAAPATTAVITFGDSITDGFGATLGKYHDWPNQLAERLSQQSNQSPVAVVNEGIGGNRVLHDGMGLNSLARFDRDVLSNPGVSSIIFLEGINDLGWPHMKPPKNLDPEVAKKFDMAAQDVTADELIGGIKQIIERAHEHGIKVFGATILPFEGADYYSQPGEEKREAVNEWIRTSHAFDGVVDLEAAVRDPIQPKRILESYQIGDHLHPNDAGYKVMADAISLAILRGGNK